MDKTDGKIIDELKKDGRMTMKELGARVHLTGQAAATRVLKLEEEGLIDSYTIRVNEQKLGYPVHCFLNIYTDSLNHQPYFDFLEKSKSYVRNNYKISGEGCYLLECRFPDNEVLDEWLMELNQKVGYKLSIVIRS
ncbi:winged helix-turn-helix transcriptional regulator [Halobacillus litoralis]|uniref:Winged helix-turn-helix transcriptional regulator n=1 Tax=Halobacillus litoralis TaxID=45668 RepID=A0A845DM44_9BACI|nr:winged helix-turn-helix transcriptional regulator [Halobacillus litoralis]MYL18560.1 winged helix-turn-helix transcriptional regulator [Halobacillus litoralis]